MSTPSCDGMYSKLMDDEALYANEDVVARPDVGYMPTRSSTVAPKPSGPRIYQLTTIGLAILCAILLISIIAVAAHYKKGGNELAPGQTDGQIQKQKQDANITELSTRISKLQQEKSDLQKQRDELLAKIAAMQATKAPEVVTRPVTSPPITCPPNWVLFNDSCYLVSRHSLDWSSSQKFCQDQGGHLAIILSAEEQTFLWNLLPRGHWNAYWFGISDEHTEDTWKWVDGTPVALSFWEEGEPNNHIDEDCGYMVKTRKLERVATKSWYDAPCTMYWPFICEKEMVNTTSLTPPSR